MAIQQAPYGDIISTATPTLDRLAQQMYAEQKQRQLIQYRENQALESSLQKEFAKVRSVDTPEVINSWNEYKNGKKQLMFDHSLQKDPIAYNRKQQEVNAALQKTYSTINKSTEIKNMQEEMVKDHFKNADNYKDDFGQRAATLMNTPISQLQNHPQFGDLTNMDNYRDDSINTDFGKIVREAVGQPRQVYAKKAEVPGGLETVITPFNYPNKPLQVKNYIMGAMGMRNAGKDAAKMLNSIPQEELANTFKQYQALPKEYWENMGEKEPQDLMPKNPDSKQDVLSSYLAMKNAIATQPVEGKTYTIKNEKAIEDLKFDRQKQMEEIKQGNREALVRLRKKINPSDTEMNNLWYQSHLDNIIEDAKTNKEQHHVYTNKGRSLYYYDLINPDAFTMKAFARDKGEPDRIGVTSDNKIVPIFFKRDAATKEIEKMDGQPVVDQDYSKPMTYDQALINLGYRGATKKQLGKDLSKTIKTTSGKNYSLDGKTYSHKELNDMGYDDDEIDEALKAGLIK